MQSATAMIDAAVLPASPMQIELQFVLGVPPSEAFDLVAHRLPEWFHRVRSVTWDHSRSPRGTNTPGECSERVCSFDGKSLCEVITSYEPGRKYSYRVDFQRSEMKMPIEEHLATFEVAPHVEGSLVVWRQYFRPKWFVPGLLLRWQMKDHMMKPAVAVLLANHGGHWV